MISKPTIDQFKRYQAAYDYFNRTLFGGCLKPCLLVFRDGKRSAKGVVVGHFAANRWSRGKKTCHEISLNPETLNRSLSETMSTLVHEMAHQWQQDHGTPPRPGYHDREWAAKMVEIGLIPSESGRAGGKQTGQRMDHYIERGGRFAVALAKMPKGIKLPWVTGGLTLGDTEKAKPQRNKVKYTCESCGSNVWGKPAMNIICGECDEAYAAA